MKMLFKMAFRNLIRSSRRTGITLVSIAIGLALILWLQAVLNGGSNTAVKTVTRAQLGKLQIHHQNFLEARHPRWSLPEIPEAVKKLPPEVHYAPRIFLPALLGLDEKSSSAVMNGINPALERNVTVLEKWMVAGEYVKTPPNGECTEPTLVIGSGLAKLLDAELGSKIVALTQALDGSLGGQLFRVSGIFHSGSREFDRLQVFSSIECVRASGAVNGINEIAIAYDDERLEKETLGFLRKELPPPYVVSNWRQALPQLNAMVNFNSAILKFAALMLTIVLTLGILNTLLVSVFERTKEFGMVRALGVPRKTLISIVLAECLLLGVFASALGSLIGGLAIFRTARQGFDLEALVGKNAAVANFVLDPIIYPVVNFTELGITVVACLVCVTLSGAYPAYRASRLRPIEALRGE